MLKIAFVALILIASTPSNSLPLNPSTVPSALAFDSTVPVVAFDADGPKQVGSMFYVIGTGLKVINPMGEPEVISAGGTGGAPVVTSYSGVTSICTGYVTNNGTITVVRSDGDCMTAASPTPSATGLVSLNFATGTFSGTPNCTCSIYHTSPRDICGIDSTGGGISNGNVKVLTTGNNGTDVNRDFMITCIGPKN